MKKSSTLLNLIAVILLAVTVVGVLFFVNPMQVELDDLQAELDEKETTVTELTDQVAELEAMRDELGTSGVSEEKLLLQVPDDVDQSGLITDLSELAEEAGVELHGMSFSMVEGAESGVISVSASFDGDYEDLVSFLETVEDNTRKITVDSISVQLSEESSVAHASFGLLMEAYYQ